MAYRRMPTDVEPKGEFSAQSILTEKEKLFYDALLKALNNDYIIFPKVRLCDIVQNSDRRDFTRISQKHVDFLVCDKHTLKPYKVVELDGSHHNFKKKSRS